MVPDTEGLRRCFICWEKIPYMHDALTIIRGQWLPDRSLDVPVMAVDTDSSLEVVNYPNGQMALVPGEWPISHAHMTCMEMVLNQGGYYSGDEDEEDSYEKTCEDDATRYFMTLVAED